MVLAGGHGQNIFAIHHYNKAGLFTVEKLFDNHAMAGFTKGIARQHIADRFFSFLQGHGDNHALTGGQAIRFDNNGRSHLLQVGQCLVNIGKVLVVGGGNIMALQEILGEGFGSLQLRGTSDGPKMASPRWTK